MTGQAISTPLPPPMSAPASAPEQASRLASSFVNIIFMLADDLGSYDLAFRMRDLGRKPDIATPHLDQLAESGVTFDNYYVQPICTPTRASLLSGRYSIHTGSEHRLFGLDEPSCLPIGMPLMPMAFKALGYQTHMIGKCVTRGFTSQPSWVLMSACTRLAGGTLATSTRHARHGGVASIRSWATSTATRTTTHTVSASHKTGTRVASRHPPLHARTRT